MTSQVGLAFILLASSGCGVALDFDPRDDLGGRPGDAATAADAPLGRDDGVTDTGQTFDGGTDAAPAFDGGAPTDAGLADATALDAIVSVDAGAPDLSVVVDAFVPECMHDSDCVSPDLCAAPTCSGGVCTFPPRDCDDANPCTNDGCMPATGACIHRDVVCDDANMCTVDSCDSSTGSCRNPVVDFDGDGQSPAALGSCGLDCNDMNASVFRGQPLWFTTGYPSPMGGGSFDYDCSGRAELEYATFSFGACTFVGPGCSASGWVFSGTSMLPVCGATGSYRQCVLDPSGSTCTTVMHDALVQGCH